jgi:hypothetical protein
MSSTSLLVQNNTSSTNTLARSTSNTSQSQLFGQSQSQSPASKIKNAAVSALTPQKGATTPSGAQNASPAASTPGRWQHPRMDEIVRRQNSSCFNPGDSRIVILNGAAILAIFIAQPYLSAYVPDPPSLNPFQANIPSQHPHPRHPQHSIHSLHPARNPAAPPHQHGYNPRPDLPPPRHLRRHSPHTPAKARPRPPTHEPPRNASRRSTIHHTSPLLPQRHASLLLRLCRQLRRFHARASTRLTSLWPRQPKLEQQYRLAVWERSTPRIRERQSVLRLAIERQGVQQLGARKERQSGLFARKSHGRRFRSDEQPGCQERTCERGIEQQVAVPEGEEQPWVDWEQLGHWECLQLIDGDGG